MFAQVVGGILGDVALSYMFLPRLVARGGNFVSHLDVPLLLLLVRRRGISCW